MPGFEDGFLGVPTRPGEPRDAGLTHVIDKGLGPRAWQDVLETCGEYISIVKLGWGTAAVTQNLRAKLDVLRGKPVVIGGTVFQGGSREGQHREDKARLDRPRPAPPRVSGRAGGDS